jgi:hypothetical protein
MLLSQLFEDKEYKTVCIFPGGFHILSPGHLYVWKYLKKKFPEADLYAASSNKTTERPFSFKEKQFLASQAGIPPNKFVEVSNPYRAIEITRNYDPTSTILIFGLSSKDKDRLSNPIKKDGTLSYLQELPSTATPLSTFDKHAYYVIVPSVKYKILGQEISSASKIRQMYIDGNENERSQIIRELYPRSMKVDKIKEILDRVLLQPKELHENDLP